MGYRSAATQTLADLRILLVKLEQNRNAHDPRSFAELRRILLKRIGVLSRELEPAKGAAGTSEGGRTKPDVKRAA